MRFPRYPEYKESGVEWLGEVPSHWNLFHLKRDLTFLTSGSRGWADHYSSDGALFIRIGNLTRDSIKLDLADVQRVAVPDGTEGERTKVQAGDLLFSITAFLGSVAVAPPGLEPSYVSQHVALARLRQNLFNPFWVGYVALSHIGKTYLGMQGYGGTKIQLSLNDVAEIPIPTPPYDDQSAIAAFLDWETAKIDALVAEQEKLIDLLKEKRQAVISHAVTKGLDPNVPMKDSGVEWLGKVPEHWHVCPLKYLVSFSSGGTPSKDNLNYWEGDIPWASAKDLKTEKLNDTVDHITQLAVDTGVATLLPATSILVVVRGMILARTFPVTQTTVPMAINQDLKGIWPTDGLTPDFLAWLLRGSADESLLRLDEAGHGTKALRMDAWTSMRLPVPPKGEQVEIVKVLDAETAKLDNLVSEATKAIDLLKERRTALISAAVTGKIDVRAFHPELTEAA